MFNVNTVSKRINNAILQKAEKEKAATKIQATFRGVKNRKMAGEMKAEKEKAATKIQATFRGVKNRKMAGEIRAKKEEAAKKKKQELVKKRIEYFKEYQNQINNLKDKKNGVSKAVREYLTKQKILFDGAENNEFTQLVENTNRELNIVRRKAKAAKAARIRKAVINEARKRKGLELARAIQGHAGVIRAQQAYENTSSEERSKRVVATRALASKLDRGGQKAKNEREKLGDILRNQVEPTSNTNSTRAFVKRTNGMRGKAKKETNVQPENIM